MITITKSDDTGFNIEIGNSQYRFDTSNGYPVIFSRQARLLVPNVDNWCLNQTQGKFSYREIKLMADAYRIGYMDGLSNRDMAGMEVEYCSHIIKTIFEKGFIDELMDAYWLECTKKSQFISKFVPHFMKSFDEVLAKYGEQVANNFLRRIIRRLEVLEQDDFVLLLTKKITDLKQEPTYPDIRGIAESIINKYGKKGIANEPSSTSS